MTIYVFGNPLMQEDSMALKILSGLKKTYPLINFIVADPNENFPPKDEKDLIILDTVKRLEKPTLFSLADLEEFKKNPISPHDYDLGMHLLLLRKIKRINTVKIIGIPPIVEKKDLDKVYRCIDTMIRVET